MVKAVGGVYQFNLKNAEGKTQQWSLDLRNGNGSLKVGAPIKDSADVWYDGPYMPDRRR